jgi:sugar lactone lactonase YvrE
VRRVHRVAGSAAALVLSFVLLVRLNAAQAQTAGPTTIASFAPPRFPESVAVDAAGNVYATLFSSGEVARIAPDGSVSTLTTFKGSLAGVAVEAGGSLLVSVSSMNAAGADRHGVWRVRVDGSREIAAAIEPPASVNDILPIVTGGFYGSNFTQGYVWRVGADGAIARWAEHDVLKGDAKACTPGHASGGGANGMAFAADGSVLVANTSKATIVRVPVNADGSAGTPVVWAGPDCANLVGADGIAADGGGGVYVASNLISHVVRVAPGGGITALASAADGIDVPTSVKVGTGKHAGSLIVTRDVFPARRVVTGPPRPGVLSIPRDRVAARNADPSALFRRWIEGQNRGDVATQLGIMTDDAVLSAPTGGLCAAQPCAGKDAIRRELERRAAAGAQVATPAFQVTGNVGWGRLEVSSPAVRAAGVERYIVQNIVVSRGDQIMSIRADFDRTDPQTDKYAASLSAAAAPAAPAQLPRTGGTPLGLLLLPAAAIAAVGLALSRFRRHEASRRR